MAAVNSLLRVVALTIAFAMLALVVPSYAWWGKGHMAVAEVARRNLNADVLAKVEACAVMLNKMGPFPQTTNMVEMGPWADDLKSLGLYTMSTWHFIDLPYNPGSITMTINPVETVNVESVIPLLISAVTASSASSDSIVTSVANLIHYVGDIHQPLHSSELFSSAYPVGDLGGNEETVIVNATANTKMKLHAFWDSMGEGPQADPSRPLNASYTATLAAFVDNLIAQNIFTEAEMLETNSTVMATESFDHAVQYVYPGVSSGTVLSQTYKDQAQFLSYQRVTLAGYRLATILNSALSGVSLDRINNSTKQIEAAVEVTQTGDTHNYYELRGVDRGAAGAIFLASFVIGCLLATAVVLAVLFALRARKEEKKTQPDNLPQSNA